MHMSIVTQRYMQVMLNWKKDAKKMGAFVDMLSEDMPYECALVTQFDWVARNLFNL